MFCPTSPSIVLRARAASGLLFSAFAYPGGQSQYIDHDAFLQVMRGRHEAAAAAQPTMSYPEYVVLSGLAAMVGATCVFPMDKIKTRLQTSKAPGVNILTVARDIVQKEGVLRLYR